MASRAIYSEMWSALPDERLVFVDLETAGGEPWRPIIQLAAIAVTSELRELECFEAKLRFDERFADRKTLLGGRYSPEEWRAEAKPAGMVIEDFAGLLRRHATVDQVAKGGAVYQVAQLVAHNAAFDAGFLDAWFSRFERFLPASPRVLCTMQRAIWLFHEDKSLTPPMDFKLQTLCQYFGVRLCPQEAHDALVDVRATVELYRRMAEWRDSNAGRRGVETSLARNRANPACG
jgi:DNA polymerase III epsilon subunit-like protein